MPKILYAVPGPMSKTALGQAEVERRGALLAQWAAPGTETHIRDVPAGPASIESAYEEYISVAATAALLRDAEAEGFDAAILGCFGDPGLDALREVLTTMPVVGPGETSFHLAAMLGERFGIVTVAQGVVAPLAHVVARAGLSEKLAGISVTDMPVLEITGNREHAIESVCEKGQLLVDERGADVLVLGCMSKAFLDITGEVEEKLGVPVVNAAKAALHTAELLARTGLSHSKRTYPTPAKIAAGRTLEDLYLT
jgi:allantoin racemase